MRLKIIPVSVEFDNFDNDPLFIVGILKIQYGSEYEIECKKNLFKYVLRPTKSVLSEWVFLNVATPAFRAWAIPQMTGTGGLQRVPRDAIEKYSIPLPPLAEQKVIVAEIEAEQALVNANRELITRMEKKIQSTLARVWGE